MSYTFRKSGNFIWLIREYNTSIGKCGSRIIKSVMPYFLYY